MAVKAPSPFSAGGLARLHPPIRETCPPRIRPYPHRLDPLRRPLNIPQLVKPDRRGIVDQNPIRAPVHLGAPCWTHLPHRAVDHRIESGIAVRRLVVAALLDLGARPLLANR